MVKEPQHQARMQSKYMVLVLPEYFATPTKWWRNLHPRILTLLTDSTDVTTKFLVQIIDLPFIASFQESFLFICSPDRVVLSLFLSWWFLPLVTTSLPLASAISSAAGFIKLHFPALCLFPPLHVPTGLVVLCLCPCASCSNMHGLTHSLLVGGGFHLVDLASPSTPRRPIQGPIALHSADQQMLFR